MIRRHSILLVALLIAAAFWAGARLNGFSLNSPTQAQATKPSEARKWDYCTIVVGWDSKRNSPTATIGFITATGRRFEPLASGAAPESLSVAFAKLGSEGWEFVGQVMFNPAGHEYRPDTWLFKRPAL